MIIFFPIVPILVAIVVLILALTIQVASVINVITTVAWVLLIMASIAFILYGIFRKATSLTDRIAGIIIPIISTVLSIITSKTFLMGISSTDTSGLVGIIEFLFVLIFGGSLWLACVGLCAFASFNSVYDYDCEGSERYFRCVACIIGSCIIAGIFGFL